MNRITSLGIVLAVGLSLSVCATAKAQCSARTNMSKIADLTGGIILDQHLAQADVQFTLWLDTANTLYVMSADPIGRVNFESFTEDEYGGGGFEVDGLVCKVACFSEGGLHIVVYGPGIEPVAFVVAANGVAAPVSIDVQPTPTLEGVDLNLAASDAAFQGWGYASDKAVFGLDGATMLLVDSGTRTQVDTGYVIEIESQDLENRNTYLGEIEDELDTGVTITSRIANQFVVTDTAVVYMTGIATTMAVDGGASGTVFHPLRVGDADTSIWTWVDVLDSSYAEHADLYATCTTCTPAGNTCRTACRTGLGVCMAGCDLDKRVLDLGCYLGAASLVGASVGCGPAFLICLIADAGALDFCLMSSAYFHDRCSDGCNSTYFGCVGACPP